MNKNSNSFTFIFASVMVVVVAVLLASAAIGLAPFQDKNVKMEKMQNILSSVGIVTEREQAEALFEKYITGQIVLNYKGEPLEGGKKAFDIELHKELKKPVEEQLFPLFICNKEGQTFYIIPMRGKGLWGPIWGYIALDAEGEVNAIYGASFDHKTETPGLGAEINTAKFQKQYVRKKIFDENGQFVSVKTVKGGVPPGDLHSVDALSGGTITSNGVTEMVRRTLNNYVPYFKAMEKKEETAPVETETGEKTEEETES